MHSLLCSLYCVCSFTSSNDTFHQISDLFLYSSKKLELYILVILKNLSQSTCTCTCMELLVRLITNHFYIRSFSIHCILRTSFLIQEGNHSLCEKILKQYKGIVDSKCETTGDTPLIAAARNGHKKVIKIFPTHNDCL